MLTTKEKSDIQESLTKLYLRLNGYFTTGYIIHSSLNRIESEVDTVAVRFPFHKQDDTEHNSSAYLEIPNNIDIIICEVKSKGKSLQFNKSLRNLDNIEPWIKILLWTGIIISDDAKYIANTLAELVQTKENSELTHFKSTDCINTPFGIITIRPILFSPERINLHNADKFVSWSEINSFIEECLCPQLPRQFCGTSYDYTAWGLGLNEIVKVYKDRRATEKFTSIEDLYTDIENYRKKSSR